MLSIHVLLLVLLVKTISSECLGKGVRYADYTIDINSDKNPVQQCCSKDGDHFCACSKPAQTCHQDSDCCYGIKCMPPNKHGDRKCDIQGEWTDCLRKDHKCTLRRKLGPGTTINVFTCCVALVDGTNKCCATRRDDAFFKGNRSSQCCSRHSTADGACCFPAGKYPTGNHGVKYGTVLNADDVKNKNAKKIRAKKTIKARYNEAQCCSRQVMKKGKIGICCNGLYDSELEAGDERNICKDDFDCCDKLRCNQGKCEQAEKGYKKQKAEPKRLT